MLVTMSALTGGVSAEATRASGTLEVNATLNTTRNSSASYCPPGTPSTAVCVRYVSKIRPLRGLGRISTTYTKVITSMTGAGCEVSLKTAVLDVAGKGAIELSTDACWRFALPISVGPFVFTVTGGSGLYAGATGSLTFTSSVYATFPGSRDTWAGTIAVPGAEFDFTPPTLNGAVSRTVRAPRRAKRVRVPYTVTADDAIDGPLRVFCAPRSGSLFPLGRTKVTCGATDTSMNEAKGTFTVTVKRHR